MSRPSFQFYHGDWISNAKLRRCTHEEKGVWIDVLCLMADSDEFGVLRWPLKEIADAVHCKVAVLHSLIRKGVLKGAEEGRSCEAYIYTPRSGRRMGNPVTLIPAQGGPIWYSSKQVRDDHISRQRALGGSTKGTGDAAPKVPHDTAPKPPFGVTQGANSPSPTPSPAPPEKQSALEPPVQAAPPPTRTGAACALLRGLGVNVTPADPRLLGWLGLGATDEQLREAVERARLNKPSPDRIPAAYLDPIVREVVAGPPQRVNGHAEPVWWGSESATIAKGEQIGVRARPGEEMHAYRQRIREALAREQAQR